jgi:hypothetical protein
MVLAYIESHSSNVDDDEFGILKMSAAAVALIGLSCQASKAPKVATQAITLDEALADGKKETLIAASRHSRSKL